MQSNKSFQSSLNLKNKLKQPKFVHICVEKRSKNFGYQSINMKLA